MFELRSKESQRAQVSEAEREEQVENPRHRGNEPAGTAETDWVEDSLEDCPTPWRQCLRGMFYSLSCSQVLVV